MIERGRILELDVFRGLSVALMILVDAGVAGISTLEHSAWEGLTLADLGFPGFVLAMGISAAVSSSKRQPSLSKIFRRAGILFLLGLVFNAFMAFMFDWQNLRILGILQRLALTYLFGMLILRKVQSSGKILAVAFALLAISSLGFHLYAPENPFDETKNLSTAIDLKILGAERMYTPTNEPEGLYGTLASVASMLLGILAGRILIEGRKNFWRLIIFSAGIFLAGEVWSLIDIVAKKLWTAPFALITSSAGIFLLAALIKLFELSTFAQKFFEPVAALGKNPLLMFFMSGFALIILFSKEIAVNGLLFLALWLVAAEILARLGVVVKV